MPKIWGAGYGLWREEKGQKEGTVQMWSLHVSSAPPLQCAQSIDPPPALCQHSPMPGRACGAVAAWHGHYCPLLICDFLPSGG